MVCVFFQVRIKVPRSPRHHDHCDAIGTPISGPLPHPVCLVGHDPELLKLYMEY